MEGNEDQDVINDTQEAGCFGIEQAGPQDIGASEPSQEYMDRFAKAVDLYQQKDHRCF